jgi:hypothetical protein
MWIKVWQRWASGEYEDSCTYHEVEDETSIKELIEELNESHEWSDKFRGSQYRKVDAPPKKWLQTEVSNHDYAAATHTKLAKRYRKMLESM